MYCQASLVVPILQKASQPFHQLLEELEDDVDRHHPRHRLVHQIDVPDASNRMQSLSG